MPQSLAISAGTKTFTKSFNKTAVQFREIMLRVAKSERGDVTGLTEDEIADISLTIAAQHLSSIAKRQAQREFDEAKRSERDAVLGDNDLIPPPPKIPGMP